MSEIEALGRQAVAVRADVSSWDQVHDAVAAATDALGVIDRVANVAGGAGFGMGAGPLLQIGEREWDQVLDVNFKGTWMVARACAARMVDAGVRRPHRQRVVAGGQARVPDARARTARPRRA